MATEQNQAAEMLANWQNQMQEYFKDPRLMELMVEQYSKFQDNFKNANTDEKSGSSSNDDVSNDVYAQLVKLANRVDELESRIRELEAKGSKS